MFQNQQNANRGAPLGTNRLQNGKLGEDCCAHRWATGADRTLQVEERRNGRLEGLWEVRQACQTRKQEQTAAYRALRKLWARNLRRR